MIGIISPTNKRSSAMRAASLEIGKMHRNAKSAESRKKSFFGLYTGEELRDRVTSFLRRIYANKAADNTADDIGLPPDTVKKWFARQNTPNGLAVARMIAFYGPELLAEIVVDPPAWLNETRRAREIARIQEQQDQLAKRLEEIL